jgi:hypothetical protein
VARWFYEKSTHHRICHRKDDSGGVSLIVRKKYHKKDRRSKPIRNVTAVKSICGNTDEQYFALLCSVNGVG